MSSTQFSWQCPACAEPLQQQNKQWSCLNNHAFDCAKEGYVNLLLAQHKNSKMPGDSKEMVNARRAFLSEGHYEPLAISLGKSLQEHFSLNDDDALKSKESLSLFDAGCGEGYYLDSITQSLSGYYDSVVAAGVDIAKPAVAKAAKQYNNARFAVASTFSLPLADNTQDAVVQVFAPSSELEIHRVLKRDALWLQVNPAAEHLMDLKKQVYDRPKPHNVVTTVPEKFSLLEQKQVAFTLDLQSQESRKNLLMMTPFYWTVSADKKASLLDNLVMVQAHFDIKIMRAK